MTARQLLALIAAFSLWTPQVSAADAAKGASCSEFANGANACNMYGCFICTAGTWVEQPLYLGASSATCDSSTEGLQRYNSTTKVMEYCNGTEWSLMVSTPVPPGDDTPGAFSFTDVIDQPLGALILSNTLNITGIDSGVLVTVSGSGSPQININGAGWVTAGTINSGDTLQVRLISSLVASTAYVATVTVGDTADNWSVTTLAGQLKIFRTPGTYNGNLGGLSGADTLCQSAAGTLGYAGSYKAILSDATTDAKDRFSMAYPVVRASDGTVVEASNLWDGSLTNAVTTSSTSVWGGSSSAGLKVSAHCSSWSDGSTGSSGQYGTGNSSTPEWLNNTSANCSAVRALYCLEQ